MIIKKLHDYLDPSFRKLQQEYEAEFSAITGYKPNSQGVFDQEFLASTWSKNGYDIYLFEIGETAIGFAVVKFLCILANGRCASYPVY
jgi:hypothetical protein